MESSIKIRQRTDDIQQCAETVRRAFELGHASVEIKVRDGHLVVLQLVEQVKIKTLH